MRRVITLAAIAVFAALALSSAGCTMHIAMNPSAASETEYQRIPCRLILFMDSAFTHYHWQSFSGAELRGLDYDLGGASKNIFYDAFRRSSDNVTVTETRPVFPVDGQGGIVLVVRPRIGSFREEHNTFIRNADYYATITYSVTVHDQAGGILLEKDYTGTGVETGSGDVYRNYAAPAEKAMARAVRAVLDDISRLASSPKAP